MTDNRSKQVKLFGPRYDEQIAAAYGGGVGGYTRNMKCYINYLNLKNYDLTPLYATVRGQYACLRFTALILPLRFVIDAINILKCVVKSPVDGIHVLGCYNTAIYRELFLLLICKLNRKKIIYDVKGGYFISTYRNKGRIYKWCIRTLVKYCDLILTEGRDDCRMIYEYFNVKPIFFPNFVPDDEIPLVMPPLFPFDVMRILYVGFCYTPKGVINLMEGCSIAASKGCKIELTYVGSEHDDFSRFADAFVADKGLSIIRHGQKDHDFVLKALSECDVYGYPTWHLGEGHNNSINEALMLGRVAVTSRHGFLTDVLGEGVGFLLDSTEPDQIAKMLVFINQHRSEAIKVGKAARKKAIHEYSSTAAANTLQRAYDVTF